MSSVQQDRSTAKRRPLVRALIYFAVFAVGLLAGRALWGSWPAGVQFGLSLLLYGVVYRTLFSWHVTWGVNSLGHLWGYRNYQTDDNSRNNWFVALVSNGEGWHNNHHADQRSAAHGHRWWEFDVTYLTIRMLHLFGLARDVVTPNVKVAEPKATAIAATGTSSSDNLTMN